jgi:RND family efflux transporter MFP subunit
LHADVGSKVKAGQVIAELDNPDLEAQLGQAEAQLGQAVAHYDQQLEGVEMERQQTNADVSSASSAALGARAHYESAQSAAIQQPNQTASDIRRSEAALATAKATLDQAQKSHDLEIASAQAAVDQAQATDVNAKSNVARETKLLSMGFVPAMDAETAETAEKVAAAQLASSRQNLSLATAKADADVQTAQQQVSQAQANLDAARSEKYVTAARQQDARNALSQVKQADAQLKSAQAGLQQNVLKTQDVKAAKDAVKQAQQTVAYQKAQIAKTMIRSPISGTVLSLAAQQGETVAAGLSAPTLIVVADLNRLQVDAYVDETDIGKVRLGQDCSITVDAYPDQTFSGRIFKIASGATVQENVVTYDVSVKVNDPKHLLKPDMTATVNVSVGVHPNVISVPNEAIKQTTSGKYVWVVPPASPAAPNPTPQMSQVETGATDGTYTEIKSGVEDGDTVVLAGWPPSGGAGGPGGFRMTPFGPARGGRGGGRR